ncbi:hypothetical protein, partial [Nocardia farcinica]|uniref:hypothetical protein n=1 Tax=Nocardia farcinica TaxID=37329 RepID=UPI0024578F79
MRAVLALEHGRRARVLVARVRDSAIGHHAHRPQIGLEPVGGGARHRQRDVLAVEVGAAARTPGSAHLGVAVGAARAAV